MPWYPRVNSVGDSKRYDGSKEEMLVWLEKTFTSPYKTFRPEETLRDFQIEDREVIYIPWDDHAYESGNYVVKPGDWVVYDGGYRVLSDAEFHERYEQRW